jgi:hypothetical protein
MSLTTRRHAWAIAVGADVVAVVVFVVIGRANHHESDGVRGVWDTAWPFLLGAALGLALTAYARRTPTSIGTGVRVWVWTVVIGLVVRGASGGGLAPAFVVVATVVLGVFLVGWRLALTWRTWRRRWHRVTG